MACPGLDQNTTCVRFVFQDISSPSDSWILERVEVTHIDWDSDELFMQRHESGISALYQLCFGLKLIQYMPVDEDHANDCIHYTKYTPQWPWLLAQICLYGGTDGWIMYRRLGHVLGRMDEAAPRSPFQKWQNQFKAPTDPAKFPWKLTKFEQWQMKMGDILGF